MRRLAWLAAITACAAGPHNAPVDVPVHAALKVYDLSIDGRHGSDSVWRWTANGEESAFSRTTVGDWTRDALITRTDGWRFVRGQSTEISRRGRCVRKWEVENNHASLFAGGHSNKGNTTTLEVENRYYLDVPLITAIEWSVASAVPFADATSAVTSPSCGTGGGTGVYPAVFRLSGSDRILLTRWRLEDAASDGADSLWWNRRDGSISKAVLSRQGETPGRVWRWSIRN